MEVSVLFDDESPQVSSLGLAVFNNFTDQMTVYDVKKRI
jgi:hypothetical protein